MKKQILVLGLIGMMLWPARQVLHVTHKVAEVVANTAERLEIKLHNNNPVRDTLP